MSIEQLEPRRLLATLDVTTGDLVADFADLTITRVAADYHFNDASETIGLTPGGAAVCTTVSLAEVSCPVASIDSIDIVARTIIVAGDIETTGDISLQAINSGTSASDDVDATITADGVLIDGANITLNAEASLTPKESGDDFERSAKLSGSLEFAVESNAVVSIANTVIKSTGNVTINADSVVDAVASAVPESDDETERDAAVAIAIVNSTAIAEVTGTTNITLDGVLNITANNNSTIGTTSDGAGSGGGIGGVSLALTISDNQTKASLEDDSSVTGATDINVVANSSNAAATTAIATPRGATEGTAGDTRSEEELADNEAETSDGDISFAATIAIANITESTQAFVSTNGSITATGNLTVQSLKTTDHNASADSSAVEFSEPDRGVAVAVAIARTDTENDAYLDGNATFNVDANKRRRRYPWRPGNIYRSEYHHNRRHQRRCRYSSSSASRPWPQRHRIAVQHFNFRTRCKCDGTSC